MMQIDCVTIVPLLVKDGTEKFHLDKIAQEQVHVAKEDHLGKEMNHIE